MISTNASATKSSVSPTSGVPKHEPELGWAGDSVWQASPEVVADNGLHELVPSRLVLGTVLRNQVVTHE